MMKKQITLCLTAAIILCSACGTGKNQIKQIEESTTVAMIINETLAASVEKTTTTASEGSKENEASKESADNKGSNSSKEGIASNATRTEFKLTEKNKSFLQDMCQHLPEFTNPYNLDGSFWHDFLFLSYTGKGGDQYELVSENRKDTGLKETQIKVSKAEVQAYVKQVLGFEMPAYEPTVKERKDGQTSMYYQDGYYYIGVSDFGDTMYKYKSTEIQKDDTISVIYQITDSEGADLGTVEFLLLPETNENGFVVTAKMVKYKNQ